MAQVLIRRLDPDVLERLRRRARLHGVSLEEELRGILRSAAASSTDEDLVSWLHRNAIASPKGFDAVHAIRRARDAR